MRRYQSFSFYQWHFRYTRFCAGSAILYFLPPTPRRRFAGRSKKSAGRSSYNMSVLTQKALSEVDSLLALAAQSRDLPVPKSVSTRALAARDLPQTASMGKEVFQRRQSMQADVEAIFQEALDKAFPNQKDTPIVTPTKAKDTKFGDYQCNNAMKLFNLLKGKEGAPKNPRAVGEAILNHLPKKALIAGTPTLAGPGFINIKISPEWLAERITLMLKGEQGASSWAPALPYKKALVDFSSPNVAKEMHVGHLRSTIIGDTICRVLEFCGVEVLRLNHVGDWGTQFGMLIQHIDESREGGLAGTSVEEVSDLQKLYKDSKKRFDNDAMFKTKAREAVKQLQGGNPLYVQAWKRICEASRKEFELIYARLGVRIEERGESFYNPFLTPIVKELMASGVAEESNGAKVIFVEGIEVPLMIQKSDGGYGYGTTDIAAIRHRIQEEKADFIVYVTDLGQYPHFQQVFGAARKAGIIPADNSVRVEHVGFGVVLNAEGTKFKTRDGGTVRLADLLDEAKNRCKVSIRERREERGELIDDDELDKNAGIMGYAAVKYMDLKSNRKSDYKFSYDAMLNFNGDTAVYLLYSHARIASILKKAETTKGISIAELKQQHSIQLKEPAELALGLHLARFPDCVNDMLVDMLPNRIAEFLYDLSQKFTQFYSDCQVVGSEEETSRLLLCEATAVIMRQCFYLLGMTPLYRI